MGEEKIEGLSFEEALEKLEKIITRMEREDLTLEESLQSFRKGIELTRYCRKLLTEAEYKVEMLLQNDERVEFEGFGEENFNTEGSEK